MRIVVADDNLLIREGVRAVLDGAPGIELVGICHDRDSSWRRSKPIGRTSFSPTCACRRRGEMKDCHRERAAAHASGDGSDRSQPVRGAGLRRCTARGRIRPKGLFLKDRLSDRPADQGNRGGCGGGSVIDPKVVEALVAAQRGRIARPRRPDTEGGRDPRRGRSGEEQHGDRRSARDHEAGRRAPHQLDFAKLDLPDESEVSRRVTATLMFLAQGGTSLR